MRTATRAMILVGVLGVLAPPATAGTWAHDRDGFVIGFNAGLGTATVRPDRLPDDSGGGGAASFRLAWAFDGQLVVGLESTAWTGETDVNADLTLSANKLNVTWYPGRLGWFVRAGAGGGSAELKGDVGNATVSVEDGGSAWGLGAGHEWRLTRKFALGAAVDYNAVNLDNDTFNADFDFWNFTAQFNWYF